MIACIPAHNEERNIASVVVRASKYVDKVIVCDDGSTDLTGEIAERLGAEVLRHGVNMGYGAALGSLFRRARELNPDVMVILDADLQHNPQDIPKLVEPVVKGEADIVIGSRFLRMSVSDMPAYRKLGVKIISRVAGRFSYSLSDAQSGFRAYSRKALKLIQPAEQGMGASTEILLKAKEHGLAVKEIPIKIRYDGKRAKRNPFYHGLDVLLSTLKIVSIKHPLLFYGTPGLASLTVAFVFWVLTFQNFAATRMVSTNLALAAIGATLFGLILATIAIILYVLISVIRERI